MGCIHHLIKFTPRLAEISEPLRPLLSKSNTKAQNKLDWKEENTKAFENIKKQIINITENKHFDITKDTRVKSDASKKGLGPVWNKNTVTYGNQLHMPAGFWIN